MNVHWWHYYFYTRNTATIICIINLVKVSLWTYNNGMHSHGKNAWQWNKIHFGILVISKYIDILVKYCSGGERKRGVAIRTYTDRLRCTRIFNGHALSTVADNQTLRHYEYVAFYKSFVSERLQYQTIKLNNCLRFSIINILFYFKGIIMLDFILYSSEIFEIYISIF